MTYSIQDLIDFSKGLKSLAKSVSDKPFVKNSYQISNLIKVALLIDNKIKDKTLSEQEVVKKTLEAINDKMDRCSETGNFVIEYLDGEVEEDFFEMAIFLNDVYENIEEAKKNKSPMDFINSFFDRLDSNLKESKEKFLGNRLYFVFETYINELKEAYEQGFLKDEDVSFEESFREVLEKYDERPLERTNLININKLATTIDSLSVEERIKNSFNKNDISLENFKLMRVKLDNGYFSEAYIMDENGFLDSHKFDFENKVWKGYKEDIIGELFSQRAKNELEKAVKTNNLETVESLLKSYSLKEEMGQNYLLKSDIKELLKTTENEDIKKSLENSVNNKTTKQR